MVKAAYICELIALFLSFSSFKLAGIKHHWGHISWSEQ